MDKTNIVLIGMPSSGKSTVGALLAEKLGMKFIDTDEVIKQIENKALRDIVNDEGHRKFLEKQEAAILGLNLEKHVIATGGSVVFGDMSMEHLKKTGKIVYLFMTFDEIEQRVTPERRFAREKGKSLLDVYNERMPLYEKYTELTIWCGTKSVEEIVNEIIAFMKK